jgi:hypothetical protein
MMRNMQTMRGRGVLTKLIRKVDTRPKRQSVMRSPRQEAIGGAILSKTQTYLHDAREILGRITDQDLERTADIRLRECT